LFLVSSTDNIDNDQLELLASWPDSIKQARISKVKDPYAQNLLSQLLMKDPKLRPSADYCLKYHPFFLQLQATDSSRESPLARFPFIAATIDTFISFRAAILNTEQSKQNTEVADFEHANILNMLLNEREITSEQSSSNSSDVIDISVAIKLSKCSSSLIVLSKFAFVTDIKTDNQDVDLEDSVVIEAVDRGSSESKEETKMNSAFMQFVFEVIMMMEFKSRGLLEKGMFVVAIGDRIPNNKPRDESISVSSTSVRFDIMNNGFVYDSYFKVYAGEIVGKFGGSQLDGLHDLPIPAAVKRAVKEVLHICGYGLSLHDDMTLHQLFSTLLNLATFHIIGESGDAFRSAVGSISAVIDGSMIAMDAYDAVNAVSEHYRGNRPLTSAFSQMIAGRVQSTPQVLLSPAGSRHRSSFAISPNKPNSMSRQSSFHRSSSQGGGLNRSGSRSSIKAVTSSGVGLGGMGESSFFSSSFRTGSLFDQEYGLTVSLESELDDEKDIINNSFVAVENDVNETQEFPIQLPYFTEIVGEDKASTSATMVYLAEKLEIKENEVLNLEDEIHLLQEKLQLQSEELRKLRRRFS